MTPAELAQALQLQRPLVWFDLETTGSIPEVDHAVQIGALRIEPDGSVTEKKHLVNPEMPITPEATEVHGITDDDVASAPKFGQLARGLAEFLHMVDFGGYNLSFDLGVLRREFERTRVPATLSGRVIDANRIVFKYHRRDLTTMYEHYTGKKLEDAHDAGVDARAAMETFMGQLERYADLPRTVEDLHVAFFETPRDPLCLDPDAKIIWRYNEACLNFGKYPGRSLRSICAKDPGYLRWMLGADFSDTVKQILRDAQEGVFPVRKKTV